MLSLRYSSWSMRPWLALAHADARFETETVELSDLQRPRNSTNDSASITEVEPTSLPERRALGSVHGLFPVLARLRTYGIRLPPTITVYAKNLASSHAVRELVELARSGPRIPVYDDYLRGLGGQPDAALHL